MDTHELYAELDAVKETLDNAEGPGDMQAVIAAGKHLHQALLKHGVLSERARVLFAQAHKLNRPR